MLTLFKELFIWWNRQTIGTRIDTFLFGILVGKDYLGNRYYQSKSGRRWVIYNGEIEASKIPNEWYSWIHFTKNKLENSQDLKKYEWQKDHLPNQTGSDDSYHPKRNNNATKKKYNSWKS